MTPLMQQYWEIKNQHKDKILLFRMGDFYEMFYEDATTAAPILNIALTSRNKNQADSVPMCGVPHHSVGPQINKLLKKGLKVAICDQLESPEEAEGKIVRRGVTRVVTPGLVYDPDQLESLSHNYVLAILPKARDLFDLAVMDASTGEVKTSKNISGAQVMLWTQKLLPKEFVVPQGYQLFFDPQVLLTPRPLEGKSVEEFLVSYVQETQGSEILSTLAAAENLEVKCLKLSPTTLRHLEIFKTYDQNEEGSLFWAVNQTCTPMGARLLKTRLMSPFSELDKIKDEQDLVDGLLQNQSLLSGLKRALRDIGDLDRKTVKLSNPLCNARDLRALALALQTTAQVMGEVPSFFPGTFSTDGTRALAAEVLKVLREELPHSTKEGSLINPSVSSILDEYVDLDSNAQTRLSELEAREREASGIQSLKIKYNNIFGYSFEITKANLDKTPKHFVRRQTLANAERFITDELRQLEEKILSSQSKRFDLEFEIYNDLRKKLLAQGINLLQISRRLAHLDLIQSFATLALERSYTRPEFVDGEFALKKSRHPVLEFRQQEKFIPNDLHLQKGQCLLLTGPNMSGKSTLMRQVALISILAQCGCFVPAELAQLALIDQIFTRIGASDNLSEGLSTFMVEMTETAQIIKDATENSLIVLDEIGRGTSTFDGMSLAQGVLEHFVDEVKSFTLFATHYHELTELAFEKPAILNGHMSIEEHKEGLVFLRKLVSGPASRSYGIEVAKLAGLPSSITKRAGEILKTRTNRQMDLF